MNGVRQAALSKGDQGGLSKVVPFELCPGVEEPDVPRKITPVRKNGRCKGPEGRGEGAWHTGGTGDSRTAECGSGKRDRVSCRGCQRTEGS